MNWVLIMNTPEAAEDKEALTALLRANLVSARNLRSASELSGKEAALRIRLRGWQAARFERPRGRDHAQGLDLIVDVGVERRVVAA